MTRQSAARIVIDLVMTILILCALAYRIIGDIAHEWIGVSFFAVHIAHNIINLRWYKGMFRGRYNPRRGIMTVINLLLAVSFTVIIFTGLLQSRAVLSFLRLPGGMMLRQIHTTAAYWSLGLIAVHIGLHWGMIIKAAGKMVRVNGASRIRTFGLRVVAFGIVIFGVWSFFDRDMFSKLFLGFSFDYWPEERPALLFFAETLSVMAVYVFVTYHVLAWIDVKTSKKFQTSPNIIPK